jgi:hypothetical protein
MPATMQRIRKKILTPGRHNAVKNGSSRELDDIPLERMKHWVDSFNQMKTELGYKLPNPSVHYDKKGIPPRPVIETESGELIDPRTGKPTPWDSNLNLGFWDKLYIEDGALWGEVEAPGSLDDPNTPAGKLGTTIKETSIGAAKTYTDGTGKEWKDVLVHVASCVHAVEPNQENFIPMTEGEFSLMSMSSLIPDNGTNNGNFSQKSTGEESSVTINPTDPKEAIQLLRKIPIDLPDDTSQDNFIERLVIALKQWDADQKNQEEQLAPKNPKPANPNKQPKETTEKTGVVTMSTQTETKNDDLVLEMTMSSIQKETRKTLRSRLDAIVKAGALKKEQAEALFPNLDMLTMSVDDFNRETKEWKKPSYEIALDAIEAVLTNVSIAKEGMTTLSQELTQGYQPDGAAVHTLDDLVPKSEEGEVQAAESAFMKGMKSVSA